MRTALLLLAIQNNRHLTLEILAELVEPAFDADRNDWKIVERGIVNPFDSAIPGCNVSGRECPFRFHPPGDQYSQPQTNSFVVVMSWIIDWSQPNWSDGGKNPCALCERPKIRCDGRLKLKLKTFIWTPN